MKDLKNATVHLKIALGSNMNVSSLTPLAITEIMEDYHQSKLKNIGITGVSNRRELLLTFCENLSKMDITNIEDKKYHGLVDRFLSKQLLLINH